MNSRNNNSEGVFEQLEYYKAKLKECDNPKLNEIIRQNHSLKLQNKQLLMMLMSHLTKTKGSKSHDRKKKSKFEGTMLNSRELKSGLLDTSMKKMYHK